MVGALGFEPGTFPTRDRDAPAGWATVSPTFSKEIVGARGFEPRTFPIRDRDAPAGVATGSPAFSKEMVGARGFEPGTSCAQGKTIKSILLILPPFSASSITI